MSLINKILEGKPVREAVDEEFPEISAEELYDIKDIIADVEVKSKSTPFIKTKVEPYGTGFKVRLERNDNGIINLENGIDAELVNKKGWEKIDSEELKDGTVILYYR